MTRNSAIQRDAAIQNPDSEIDDRAAAADNQPGQASISEPIERFHFQMEWKPKQIVYYLNGSWQSRRRTPSQYRT